MHDKFDMHGICMFQACYMHVKCMKYTGNMYASCTFCTCNTSRYMDQTNVSKKAMMKNKMSVPWDFVLFISNERYAKICRKLSILFSCILKS